MMSGCMALSVIAVSISVSPLRMEEEPTDMFITSAPSRLPASSKEACVRVEDSKNRLICVRPRSEVRFFSIWRLRSTNSSARSRRPVISSRERPSIPNRCRWLRTKDDFGAIFIKAGAIGGVCGLGKSRLRWSTRRAASEPQNWRGRGTMAPRGAAQEERPMAGSSRFDTHDVANQTPPFENVDLFAGDPSLQAAVAANGAGNEAPELSKFGKRWGSAEMFEAARLANENPPKLKTFDASGFRRDVVEFHPAYHEFMRESIGAGLHAMTWRADGVRASAPAEVARAARYYMVAQVENGHM